MFKEYDSELLEKLKKAERDIYKDFASVCRKYDLKQFAIFGTAIGAVRHHGFIPWDDDIDLGMLRSDYNKLCEVLPKEFGNKYRISNPKFEDNYSSSITKIQLNGTKFVPAYAVDSKTDLCLHIDIFIFDHLADSSFAAARQIRTARILSQLLFLRYYADPIIPYKNALGKILLGACHAIHGTLDLTKVSPRYLFELFEKNATKYNRSSCRYVTTFSDVAINKIKMSYDQLLPLVPFEFEDTTVYLPHAYDTILTNYYGDYMKLPPEDQRVNHAPVIVQFPEDM